MDDEFRNEYERAEYLQQVLICRATGELANDNDYGEYRKHFLDNSSTKDLLPAFVRTSRDLAQFWQFIKAKYPTYAQRRSYIWDAFKPLLDYLEKGGRPPPADQISKTLKAFDAENIHSMWAKALDRAVTDPEGAITAARTLLESVCKHLLDEMQTPYGGSPDLPELYSSVAKQLNLSPTQHTEKIFRQILGGCASVVDALGSLRNRIGDAHGRGKGQPRPHARHAALAVNLAGAMAMFLVETWRFRTNQPQSATAADFPWLKAPVTAR